VALSYFGVDRIGNKSLIGIELLDQHLGALKKQGYVTITQQDIIDYYTNGKALPQKSLFLLFEDGRRDTSIFTEKLLQKYNYKGTIFTYADKFEKKDPKFLMPDELQDMRANGFWELGTNGYRLHFINVYDRYNDYLGDMDPLMHSMVQPVLGRKYNHYLMDYLRDENGYPLESYQAMKNRISFDYEKLDDVYKKDLALCLRLMS
jgi:peptidoglycan/xylan/chitin deacetylase (PgdA/CDA1 family)